MSNTDYDAIIVGGGVVGAAAALGLKQAGRRALLVEARPPKPWDAQQWDPRVYALSPSSVQLLECLGCWNDVPRPQPFTAMQVWDRSSELTWAADALGVLTLGHIAEDAGLLHALWPMLAGSTRCPAQLRGFSDAGDQVVVNIDGDELSTDLLVAADGAASPIRKQLGIPVSVRQYPARAIVAHVQCEQGHADTAWQRFAVAGPIGLLPLADGRVSVVWSLDAPDDTRVLGLGDAEFCTQLAAALDGRLGAISEPSARLSFPLHRQHAARYAQGRVLLLGDAAHSLHPLAGQGLNLGLGDVQALLDAVADAEDLGERPAVARYARSKRAANARMLALTDGLYRLFAAQDPVRSGLRSWGMNALNGLPTVKAQLAAQALGIAPGSAGELAQTAQ